MTSLSLSLTPEQHASERLIKEAAARQLGISTAEVGHVRIVRRSLDSRRSIRFNVQVEVFTADEVYTEPDYTSPYRDCHTALPVVIVGAGPAGLFAALHALEVGLRPIVVDRGQPVLQRKKDIVELVRSGHVNPDSNWCFGEGGAGTYSDGKLYTRSTKRGNVADVLKKFVEHGADPDIMVDTHAHIGTDRLGPIIANMRHTIESHGGEFHFGKRVIDIIPPASLSSRPSPTAKIRTADGDVFEGIAVVLATGHSARDIYQLFHSHGWALEAKPFALGVRVEHPQQLINEIQYHANNKNRSFGKIFNYLPPAAYSLTTQVDGHGVFSFCMCPGGVIVPAATADGQQVVNGMSNANRSSAFANSGIAVTVSPHDVPKYDRYGVLSLLNFQQEVEQIAAAATGGGLKAPCQRLVDFCEGKDAIRLNRSNYMGECVAVNLADILPTFVADCLRKAFRDFNRKMHGFYTSEASLLAVESRTSSPVRIPRNESGQHPQVPRLYPCGEGAGYAGGIVSSAIDGINQIDNIIR